MQQNKVGVAPDVKTEDQLVQLALLVFGSNFTGIVILCHKQYHQNMFGIVAGFCQVTIVVECRWNGQQFCSLQLNLRLIIGVDGMVNEFFEKLRDSSDLFLVLLTVGYIWGGI